MVHVELDVVRRRVWPGCPPSWDPYSGEGLAVQVAFEAAVVAGLAAGRDVVADRTSLNPEGIRRLKRLAPHAQIVMHSLVHVPLTVCIERDAVRPIGERVGKEGIWALHDRWIATGDYLDWSECDAA
ncbi:hypothetical protein SMD44_00979 [Streptomyces alboflavus]|uniref:Uncharacterized protein n=1 Tax=Streptomyces alboflavus TaxID=67267 RepID=A0A1Z1W585_9ACTN|nr:hypothetical protein SMD44_00979 [Streptomyces alboflavus]